MKGIRILRLLFIVAFVLVVAFSFPKPESGSWEWPTVAISSVQMAATPTIAAVPTTCPTKPSTTATTTQVTTTIQTTVTTQTTTITTVTTTQATTTQPSNQVEMPNGYVINLHDEAVEWYDRSRIYAFTNEKVSLSKTNRLWLARLLQSEVGNITSDECAIYTCSALVNMWLTGNFSSIKSMAYSGRLYDGPKAMNARGENFDNFTPNDRMFAIVDYVLSGHRVPKIRFFKTQSYHTYGKSGTVPNSLPTCVVGPHYFSEYCNRGV